MKQSIIAKLVGKHQTYVSKVNKGSRYDENILQLLQKTDYEFLSPFLGNKHSVELFEFASAKSKNKKARILSSMLLLDARVFQNLNGKKDGINWNIIYRRLEDEAIEDVCDAALTKYKDKEIKELAINLLELNWKLRGMTK